VFGLGVGWRDISAGTPPNRNRTCFTVSHSSVIVPHSQTLHRQPGDRAVDAVRWMEGCWALLDERECLIEASEPLLTWLNTTAEASSAKPFWPLLWARFPHWEKPLAALRRDGSVFSGIQLADSTGNNPAQWYRLETARVDGKFVLRIHLMPSAQSAETKVAAQSSSRLTGAELPESRKEVESNLEMISRHWPGLAFVQNPDLVFETVGDRIGEWTGVAPAKWKQGTERFFDAVHEDDIVEFQRHLARVQQCADGCHHTFRVRHFLTGRITLVLEHRRALLKGDGTLARYEGVWLDVARQTIAEKRLASAAWMETLAVLTAGLVHDFSNVIAGVGALSESFRTQLPADHPFQESLKLIKKNTHNAILLVRRILSLHQGKIGQRAYHDLNETVREMTDLVRKTIPGRITLQTELAEGSLAVFADLVMLRQAFVHLVLNAAEAMPGHGNLTIRTARHQTPPNVMPRHGVIPTGPCIELSVHDGGAGIPQGQLATIFDPFYATQTGNKTGSGFYGTRLFAEKHDGGISVESHEITGTTFYLWLPEATFTESDHPASKSRIRRTILLLGDAGDYFEQVASALRQQSNSYVVTASTQAEARELLSAPEYDISAVLAVASGPETAPGLLMQAIRAQKSRVKTILKIVGGNQVEIAVQTLDLADLVIAAEESVPEMLAKVKTLLEAEG